MSDVVALDPLVVGLASSRLESILEEQQATLVTTAFSTIVRESEDLACGVFDSAGNMIRQSRSGTPGHINAMATGVRHFVSAFPPETLEDGDVLLTNDPWLTAGQINDMTVVTPAFVGGRLMGFFASTCHTPDIGGRIISAEATEVFEEGVRLPRLKLVRGGEISEDVMAIIRANSRIADETEGDLHAQIAANAVGARGLARVLSDLGLDALDPVGAEICRRSEEAMRAAIAELPDGCYEHEVWSDGFGEPVVLRLALTIAGDEIALDYAGSSPQSDHGINVVLNYTHAYSSYALKLAIAPEVPHNAGSFAPVSVSAPEGSILNCTQPAPVAARHLVGHFLPGLVLGALGRASEGRALAQSSDSLWITVWRGQDRGAEPFNLTLFQSGGMGARDGKDGLSATGFPAAVACVPTEVFESLTPLVHGERSLIPDSGGAGRWRGGLGQRSLMRCRTDDPWTVSALVDRTQFPAEGLDGGGPGAAGALSAGGRKAQAKRLTRLEPDDEVALDVPGGGGVGDPHTRPVEAVLADVVDGYVTVERARERYGVAIRYAGPADAIVRGPEAFEVDNEETAKLRRPS
jgi:N-methylhydantoinase B